MGRTLHPDGNHPFQAQGEFNANCIIQVKTILRQLELQMGKIGSSEGCNLHQILSFASACADTVQASTLVSNTNKIEINLNRW